MSNVVLISTYELGHQPFGLASPAAWLKAVGASVTCLDLSLQDLEEGSIESADLVAIYIPMHTATRIAVEVAERVKRINKEAHLCFYGLYAPMNEGYLRRIGADSVIGGEFEETLVSLFKRISPDRGIAKHASQSEPVVSLSRLKFVVPDRSGLPALSQYAYLKLGPGDVRTVGYTEASRGCKHFCRHCPIVPVYDGRFRIVQREVVLEDIRGQVEAGAAHMTFGDPDFFNGPGHAIPIVKALHQEWPNLTYDVTIKIEHLLQHSQYLPILRDTGCLFITSAVEAADDYALQIFDKKHTREDFIQVVALFQRVGLALNPTFVTFTPWTTTKGYLDLLTLISELGLVENISPVQYAIRLLIPAGSRLLEISSVQQLVGQFDEVALCYRWVHQDPRVDLLYESVREAVRRAQLNEESRESVFGMVWSLAQSANGAYLKAYLKPDDLMNSTRGRQIPCLSEPWYCCAEPTEEQFTSF